MKRQKKVDIELAIEPDANTVFTAFTESKSGKIWRLLHVSGRQMLNLSKQDGEIYALTPRGWKAGDKDYNFSNDLEDAVNFVDSGRPEGFSLKSVVKENLDK